MSNIVINPSSGILEFNTGAANGSAFDDSLLGAARLEFKNSGQLSLTSYGTEVSEKFTIDGSNGRLFTVDNGVSGSIFSVNDAAGLPILEVFSDDRIVMGEYASDALVISGSSVQVTGSNVVTQGYLSDQSYMTTSDETYSTANELLAALLGVDGAGSNLDSDKLDGQQGSYYLDYGNFSNTPTIPSAANNATITLQGGGGITTSIGNFTTNQGTNETLTISHSDTSSQSSSTNSGRTYIQSLSLDGYGHVTSISTATETVTDTNTFRTVTAGGNTLGASETLAFTAGTNVSITESAGAVTINSSHPSISAASSSNNSGRTYIQDITLDSNGHVTSIATATETVTDTNTTYSAGTHLSLSGTTFNVDFATANKVVNIGHNSTNNEGEIILDTSTGGSPQISFTDHGDASWAIGVDDDDNSFKIHGSASSTIPTINGLATPLFEITVGGIGYLGTNRLFADNYHPNADKLTTARNIALTGAVTGNANFDGSGNISITTTATSDPTLTLAGDASGSATFTNLGNATLTVTVADDSHNHVISNVDGLQTALDAKLGSSSKAADSNLLDGIDSSSFLRSDAADELRGVLSIDEVNGGTIVYNLASDGVYIPKPQGADYVTTTTTQTGAIGIKLPTTAWGAQDMISFHVDIFDYSGGVQGESVTLHIFGYHYLTTQPWYNVGASVQSDRTDRDYTVRFGNDGTRGIVWIGETNSSWNYHQVIVRDFSAGYGADHTNWDTGWDVVANVTSFDTVNQTSSANYPVAKQLQTARNIALTGAVTGNANFDGSGNISIATTATADPTLTINGDASGSATFTNLGNATLTLTIADDSHNHTIANVDGLQTALDAKQASGTYNTIIGTDTDISYSGATVLSAMTMTDGVIQSHSSRTLTLADLGYTGATNANNYSLPEATSTVRGGIELFSDTDQSVAANAVSSTAGRTYGIQLNSAGQAVVNVPWVDTNTTYNLGSFGITATAGELNTLDGITATTTELNYTDGVTSNIQTQLNARLADSSNGTISGARNFTGTVSLGGTAITATAAELNYTDGVTSNIQTQLNGKQASGTYNTVIGTDSDIDTSGSTIIDNIYVTDGVITSMGTRTLTASDISALTQSTYEDIHWKQTGRIFTPQCTPLFYNSSGTAGTLAGVCFSRTETTTTANAWAQACLNRTITNEISWSGGGIEFARAIGVSFKCGFLASGTTAQSIRYMVGGRANSVQASGSDPLVSRGFGVEIRSRTGTTLEWRVIAHNGTSFTGGTWTDIPANATSIYTKELYIYSDGSGNIEAGIDDRGGDGSSWTTKSITGGPTANGNSTYPYICHEVVNAASGSSYARARVYDYKVFSE